MDDDIEEEFDEDDAEGPELDGDDIEDDIDDDSGLEGEDIDESLEDEEDEEEPAAPAATRRAGEDEEVDDDEDEDPDDVEEDLDTILKDRIASGDDLEDEEDEEAVDPRDPDTADGVTAKRDGEFTCHGCFMIVHPRQFGRRDHLSCPVGDEDCPSLAVVRKQLS